MGDVLFKLKDRKGRDMVLGPTHEEVVTNLVADFVRSYRDLPQLIYQIQTKLRDEPRPRGGLLRVREFIMKDLYSFDADYEGMDVSYRKMADAYRNIFTRCGLRFVVIQADSGADWRQGFTGIHRYYRGGRRRCHDLRYLRLCRQPRTAEFVRTELPREPEAALEEVYTPNSTSIASLPRSCILQRPKRSSPFATLPVANW